MPEPQLHFESVLTAITGDTYNDVQYIAFMRNAISKMASFTIIKGFFPQILIGQIMNDISDHEYPSFNLQIYNVDQLKQKKLSPIYDCNLLCIQAKPVDGLLSANEQNDTYAQLILVHPIIHYLSNTNTFNTILENISAYDGIIKFEKFLKDSFGDIFNFNHIGENTLRNAFKYEQILIRTPTDLVVPNFLINNYKPYHSFNYYFFDHFQLSDESDKDIDCHWINLFDDQKFKRFDVSQYPDTREFIKKIGELPFNDQHGRLNRKEDTQVFLTYNTIFAQNKKFQASVDNKTNPGSDNVSMLENRSLNLPRNEPLSQKQISQSSLYSIFQVLDDPTTAEQRFEVSKELYQKIDQFKFFEINNSLPTFPRFGEIYNLDSDLRSSYLYTPYSIINTFQRKNIREKYLLHRAHFATIKYKNNGDSADSDTSTKISVSSSIPNRHKTPAQKADEQNGILSTETKTIDTTNPRDIPPSKKYDSES